jgi:purine-nucleoside phosphorylase
MNHVAPQNEVSLVAQAAAYVRERWNRAPKIGVILGTGLGGLTDLLREELNLRYSEIPGFLQSTALAHVGRLVAGTLEGVPAVFLQGRCHLYEGHRVGSLVLPTQVLHALGANILIVTNASGGLNPRFRSGEVMIVEDHMNFLFRRPTIYGDGLPPNVRPNLATPYSQRLMKIAAKATQAREQFVQYGTYAAMLGPSYETRAEYRMLRKLGADAVGMSTAPESLVGASLGMEVLGLSVITNVAMPDAIGKVDAQEVCDIATSAAPVIRTILRGIAAAI